MKKSTAFTVITAILLSVNSVALSATLKSMSKDQFKKTFINKTFTSIATDNLNGRTIDNTFSVFLDDHGNIYGKMLHKPANEPQADRGVYSVAADGTFYITWQHWDGAKKLCGHMFITKNAYVSVDCDNVFHTVFMKEASQPGNHLK